VTLHVSLVAPDRELWSGAAEIVIAKTLDGDIGVLAGHTPVLGMLAEGSLVTIRPAGTGGSADVVAAIDGGFFSVADDRVSVLARQAQLAPDVDRRAAQQALDSALESAGPLPSGEPEPTDVRYYRALLRATEENG
jgi:F-type H+-transporting ATPase subunit epsilon